MPEKMSGSAAERDVARAALNMLVGLGGRERTAVEFERLLAATGLRMMRVESTKLEFSVIEAIPIRMVVFAVKAFASSAPGIPLFQSRIGLVPARAICS